MKKIPSCDECGENDTILTQVSNFNNIQYLCTECYELKYFENQSIKSNKVLNYVEVDNLCEECEEKNDSVKANLIMHGYKLCNSCKTSKTIFPI